MTVVTTVARLALNYGEISGIGTVFEKIPRVISPAQCPALIIEPGAGTIDTASSGTGELIETRTYTATLFVQPAAFGSETQGETATLVFFDRVRDYFVGRRGLELDDVSGEDAYWLAEFVGDSGYVYQDYWVSDKDTGRFHAIRFTHRIQEFVSVTYKD